MDKLEAIRQIVDEIIRQQPDIEESRCGFVHLYGVSAICAMLALQRGLDPTLCAVAGMLHDIWNYKVGDSPDHGRLSAIEAEKIMNNVGSFTTREIAAVYLAISRHSDKDSINGEMDELLKDADVLQHYLYNPGRKPPRPEDWQENSRLTRLMTELNVYR